MENNYIILSAVIDNDEQDGLIEIPISEEYELKCKSYTLARKNVICETTCISKDVISDYIASGKLVLKTKGEINPDSVTEFIDALNALSTTKASFTLNCDNESYDNMVLSFFQAEIDSYGKYVNVSLEFSEV